MMISAIIAAGGRGRRFGGDVPKQLLAVSGQPLLERSVRLFLDHPLVHEIVVALPGEFVAEPPPYLIGTSKPVRIVAGGERRQDSVANAFDAIDRDSTLVVIHDAARPFASAALITETIRAAEESGAALAALPARDTVKRSLQDPESADDDKRFVSETIPRETVFLAQTPQAFRREVLRAALSLSEAGVEATDEAALAERAGYAVRLVGGEASNIKITTPDDFTVAQAVARGGGRPARTGRAGTGYDLHRLVPGRPLVIGGVTVPSDLGALGHSDADVACHAATDAILGAAALGDIGRHFPDNDPAWKNANSLDLLARAVAIVAAAGYEVGNLDITVVLERPKIKDHIDAMRAALAAAIGIDAARVSVKGKTNEGVDAVGRGEAIAAHAVAQIRSR